MMIVRCYCWPTKEWKVNGTNWFIFIIYSQISVNLRYDNVSRSKKIGGNDPTKTTEAKAVDGERQRRTVETIAMFGRVDRGPVERPYEPKSDPYSTQCNWSWKRRRFGIDDERFVCELNFWTIRTIFGPDSGFFFYPFWTLLDKKNSSDFF